MLNLLILDIDNHIHEIEKLGTQSMDSDLDDRYKKLSRMRKQAIRIKILEQNPER